MASLDPNCPSFIVALLGNSDSGKRELYSYLNKDSPNVNFISTIGVDFAVKNVKVGNNTMKAEIWDVGYQDKFKAVTSRYYFDGAAGLILIFDVTKWNTYENIKAWLKDSYKYGNNKLVTLLIGNTSTHLQGFERVVSEKDVRNDNKASYYIETSVSNTANIESAFQRFMADIYRKQLVHAIETSPSKCKVPFKVLLLGDPDCGKLDIYSQFEVKNVRADYASTVGFDFTFRKLLIDDKTIEAQIWYITGQNRLRGLCNSYYRSAAGAILVYDITKRHSFHNISNWINDMLENSNENVVTLLIGNTGNCSKESDRAVAESEAKKFAEGKVTSFIETSTSDRTFIQRAFHNFMAEIYRRSVLSKKLKI